LRVLRRAENVPLSGAATGGVGAVPAPRMEPLGVRRASAGAPAATRTWLPTDPLRWTVFLLVVMTVSRINGKVAFLTPLRPLLLLSAAALAYAVMNPRFLSRLAWPRTWPARVVAAFAVVACLSAVFGISLGGAAMFILQDYSKVLIVAFLLMATIESTRDLHMYIWAYVIASGVLVVDSLLGGQMMRASVNVSMQRLSNFNTTYDANDLGVVLLVGLPLALYTFQMSRVWGKIVSLATMLGIGVVVAKTGSRGALVGLVAFSIAAILLIDSVALPKRVGLVLATLVALSFASPEGYWNQMKTILSPKEDYNWTAETGRRMVLQRGLSYLAAYPVFGVGINNFPMAEGTISERARRWMPGEMGIAWITAHNSHLQVASEMGLAGFSLWVTLLGGLVWSTARLGRRMPSRWATGTFDERVPYHATRCIPVATVAFAASGAFVSFAYLDPIYILAALTAGILVLTRARRGNPGKRRMRGRNNHQVPILPVRAAP